MIFIVAPDENIDRLDKHLVKKTGMTRSHAQSLIEHSMVLVNGIPQKPRYEVKHGDRIEVFEDEAGPEGLASEPIPIEILHMDEDVAVICKPAGLVVYPAPGHASGTLMNALKHYAPHLASIGGPLRPGVVHRLDKDTSGVMVVALSDDAYYSLTDQFRDKVTKRRYNALIYGRPAKEKGIIDEPIGRASADRKRMSVHTRRGKQALTTWTVLERLKHATLVEAVLGTGRTHQIRVHMASIGHPVLGDHTYGKKAELVVCGKKVYFHRQMLHARYLGLRHPRTGQWLEFESPLPEDMIEAIEELRG